MLVEDDSYVEIVFDVIIVEESIDKNSEIKRAVSLKTVSNENQISNYEFGHSLLAVFVQPPYDDNWKKSAAMVSAGYTKMIIS